MDLLARYLQAVKFFLPQKQQDDIVRELSENLISQMEDRQEELGRPLTEADEADILRRHGHPMVVAGRYGSRQQLIGPVFFPMYIFTLKMGLAAALLVTTVLAVVNGILENDPVRSGVQAMLDYPWRALMVFAFTTLGFAGLDLAQQTLKLKYEWDPRQLPKVVHHEYRISRLRSLCELVLVAGCFVWLLLLPRMPFLLLGPAAAFVEPAAIWQLVYLPALLLTVATAALHIVNFVRPYWTRTRSLARAAIHVGWLVVFATMLRTGEWFTPKFAMAPPNGIQVDRLVEIINVSVQIGLFFTLIVTVFEILRELRRMMSRRHAAHAVDSAV